MRLRYKYALLIVFTYLLLAKGHFALIQDPSRLVLKIFVFVNGRLSEEVVQ